MGSGGLFSTHRSPLALKRHCAATLKAFRPIRIKREHGAYPFIRIKKHGAGILALAHKQLQHKVYKANLTCNCPEFMSMQRFCPHRNSWAVMMNRHTILLSLVGTLYVDAMTLINVFALTHLNSLARCSFFIIFAMAVGGSKMCYMGGHRGY